MNIETLIREMHEDFCTGKTLAFAEKLEFLLEFADLIEGWRKLIKRDSFETTFEREVLMWPNHEAPPPQKQAKTPD